MKKIILYILCIGFLVGCDQDFKDLNQDPNVVDSPPLESVFTYVEKRLADYKGSEWYYDNHQIMPWMQYLVLGEANSGDVNNLQPRGGKYDIFYNEIFPHLYEIRRQIAEKPSEGQEFYKKMNAVTYVVQIFHALRISEMFGDMPYTEAGLGRSTGKLDPVYNRQADLFGIFHTELNSAIQALSDNTGDYFELGSADFIYGGDWNKWIKLANAVKLRLALRLESQDPSTAQSIIQEVVSDGRIFESENDQFTYYISDMWRGTGGAGLEWKGVLWAAKPLVDFMKKTVDPRLRIFFEPNGFHKTTLDAIGDGELPPVIDVENDNKLLYTTASGDSIFGYRYIGVPVNRNDPDLSDYDYSYSPTAVGSGAIQLSKWNQRLLMNCNKRYSGGPKGEGAYVDVLLSYAEVCFMMSEFILKDYTTGNAEDWYEKGIRSSMSTYDFIAQKAWLEPVVAKETYTHVPISNAEIDGYLDMPEVSFDGIHDLEKVYIQQYLNFYRLPDEGFTLGRRTGYPKFNSTLLARGKVDNPDLPWPRRMVTPDPGDLNRPNWFKSHEDQGFSGLDESPEILNSQRVWWDKNNPALGEGN